MLGTLPLAQPYSSAKPFGGLSWIFTHWTEKGCTFVVEGDSAFRALLWTLVAPSSGDGP